MKTLRRYFENERLSTALLAGFGVFLATVIVFGAYKASERIIFSEAAARAKAALDYHAESLSGGLEKYRILAPTTAKRPDVIAMFQAPDDAASKQAGTLLAGQIAGLSGAAEIAFITDTGEIFAARRRADDPLVLTGDITGRPFFTDAMQGRLGRFYAYGLNEEHRGYYFSAPVRDGTRPIGVVVVRLDLETVEQAWALSKDPVVAVDSSGVVFLSNRRVWRLKTLSRSGITGNNIVSVSAIDSDVAGMRHIVDPMSTIGHNFIEIAKPIPLLDLTLYVFADTGPPRAQVRTITLAAALFCMVLFLIGAIVVMRLRMGRATALRLEQRVAERTADLTAANKRLGEEVTERQAAEAELRRAQAELIQAAKLAALGQMSAALSHEYNQPLAAIGSYADNATTLIDRGRSGEAVENLGRISRLVERMAELGRRLKSFARKPGTDLAPVGLKSVVDEACYLVAPKAGKCDVEIVVSRPDDDITVIAGSVRLTQVLVNLLTNGIDAAGASGDGRVDVTIEADATNATINVSDNGPGIANHDLPSIFDPFFTTKDVGEGLGLGLSIAYNIVQEFKGKLVAGNSKQGGAEFTLTLPLALDLATAAE